MIDKLYLHCFDDDSDPKAEHPYYVEAHDKNFKIFTHEGFHFAVHNESQKEYEPDWRVTEIITGKSIVKGIRGKNIAKKAAIEELQRQGIPKLLNNIYHNIGHYGVSPMFRTGRIGAWND
jgi:hypothetical protein